MKTVEVWQWRHRTAGRWRKTRFKCTEKFIRSPNPEAIRVEHTMEMRQVREPANPWPNVDIYPYGDGLPEASAAGHEEALTAGSAPRHSGIPTYERRALKNKLVPYPTLLLTPELGDTVDLNVMATWPEANHLPLEPHAYQVVRAPEGWSVRVTATGQVIYQGAGPVELVECPVPFKTKNLSGSDAASRNSSAAC